MALNPIGSTAVDRVGAPVASGTAGTGAVSPSTSVTRIAPVSPQRPAGDPAQPLGRSGLDLLDILGTTDLLAARAPTGMVALEVGLEHARGALLRNLPGDALAALDQVWERAQRTEEGWYLRSGALTVMGLPGECERVAEEGIAQRPNSLALRFVQSVAKLAMGDSVGARTVLQPALQRAPHDPLLHVQDALALARQGDERSAQQTLSTLERAMPDHPAIAWGRQALRVMMADVSRLRSRPTPSDWPTAIGEFDTNEPRVDFSATETRAVGAATSVPRTEGESTDVTASALERFGSRVALRPAPEVAREARMLLRAFASGGTLATATRPEQAHAARVVLTAFLSIATNDAAHVPLPVRTLVAQLVPLLQHGRATDAERLVRRQSSLSREPIGRLLLAIVRGAWLGGERQTQRVEDDRVSAGEHSASDVSRDVRTPRATASATASATPRATPRATPLAETTGNYTDDVVDELNTESASTSAMVGTIRDAVERGPVVPVRLGLALLEESTASRQGATATLVHPDGIAAGSGTHAAIVQGLRIGDSRSGSEGPGNPETQGVGWGAARAAASASANEWSDGAGVRAVAVVCVALATLALVTGHGAIAIGLAVGAAWMGLRRSGRDRGARPSIEETSTTQTPPPQ